MDTLSQILWRERDLLDIVLLRLDEERLLSDQRRTQWLERAAAGIDEALTLLHETELLRAVAVDELAELLGLGADASLEELARAADEPWRTILLDHHHAIVESAAAVERARHERGARSARVSDQGRLPSLSDFLR